jgi:hypothetical protein
MKILCSRSSAPLIIPSVALYIAFHDANDIWAVRNCTYTRTHVRTFLSETRNRFSSFFCQHSRFTVVPDGSRSCRSLSLSDVPSEMTMDVIAGYKSTYLHFKFFAVSPNPRRSSVLQVHKFVDDLKTLVAKIHSSSCVEKRPISSRNHVFCLLIVDLQPFFCCFCRC